MPLLETILNSPQLPTLPAVAVRLLELSRDPEAEVKQVVETIRTDPAITAKILKASNSSYFGFRAKITSPDRAVTLLGTTAVVSLALGFSLTDSTTTAGPMYEHYNAYWLQSLVQAAATESLSHFHPNARDCEFFLAGLLADIGRLAMLKTIAKDYAPVLDAAREGLVPLPQIERDQLGFSHAEVGARLLQMWDIADPLVEAIALHHETPEKLTEQAQNPDFHLFKAVALSAAIGDYFCGANKGTALQNIKQLSRQFYDFSESQLNDFIASVNTRVEEAGDLFSMDTSRIADPNTLLAQANEQLAQLAMRAHVESAHAVARQKSIEEEKKKLESENRELQQQAVHDPLTKVYNRRFFDETLKREVDRARREAAAVGIIFVDIDHFKHLNDTYGHQCGDFVLERVAAAIGSIVRGSDVLARYGGEEFTVLVHQPTEKGLGKLAERIRERIEHEEILFENQAIHTTISVGASVAIPERTEDDLAARLVSAADAAMYDSKHNGRNQVHVRSLIQESERLLIQRVTQSRFSRWLVDRGIFDIPAISKALTQCSLKPVPIGELAQRHGYLTAEEVDLILTHQEKSGERFGRTAVGLGLLQEEELVHLLAEQKEDAALLKRALVHMDLLDERRADVLLREYIVERVPKPQARSASATSAETDPSLEETSR